MTRTYKFEPFEWRTTFLRRLRYGFRIVHLNGEIILSTTSQGYSRRIDRDTVAWNFYEVGINQGSLTPPDWAKRP